MHTPLERPRPCRPRVPVTGTRLKAAPKLLPDPLPDLLIVRLWFEAERGMQSSLHVGPSVHRFDDVMALVRFLLELADEPKACSRLNR